MKSCMFGGFVRSPGTLSGESAFAISRGFALHAIGDEQQLIEQINDFSKFRLNTLQTDHRGSPIESAADVGKFTHDTPDETTECECGVIGPLATAELADHRGGLLFRSYPSSDLSLHGFAVARDPSGQHQRKATLVERLLDSAGALSRRR